MFYVYPVTHSVYPTWFVEPINPVAETTAEEIQREDAVESERPYEQLDDGLGQNVDISV